MFRLKYKINKNKTFKNFSFIWLRATIKRKDSLIHTIHVFPIEKNWIYYNCKVYGWAHQLCTHSVHEFATISMHLIRIFIFWNIGLLQASINILCDQIQ